MSERSIDELARRLVLAMSECPSADLPASQLSPRALADLYQRLRDRLRLLPAWPLEDLADDLALTVFLARLADEEPPGPELLVALKASFEAALHAAVEEA